MKVVSRTLFATCVCLFLAKSSLGKYISGDIVIDTQDNGLVNCDSLICPNGTARCEVTKRNDPNDFKTIVRHRKCIGPNGDILQEQTLNEPNKNHNTVNLTVMSGGGVSNRPLTPEERKKLDEFLEQSRKKIQDEMKPFLDGSFAENLRNKIRNSFKHRFPMAV